MPESFIPVWMSVGEAENFQRTLHELDDSEAGLPERELSLIEGALERERRRSYAEMDAEQKAAAPSPQAEVQDCERREVDFNGRPLIVNLPSGGTASVLGYVVSDDDDGSVQVMVRHEGAGFDRDDLLAALAAESPGEQSPAEPRGDVVEVLAKLEYEAYLPGMWDTPGCGEPTKDEYRARARLHLATITPLIHLEVKERLEGLPRFSGSYIAVEERDGMYVEVDALLAAPSEPREERS
jgi:hypothetical protein